MFIKRCSRTKNGKEHRYWQLVESYRTARGPRHRVVAYLGDLAPTERRGRARLASHLDGKAARKAQQQLLLFETSAQAQQALLDRMGLTIPERLGRPEWVRRPENLNRNVV